MSWDRDEKEDGRGGGEGRDDMEWCRRGKREIVFSAEVKRESEVKRRESERRWTEQKGHEEQQRTEKELR